MTDITQSKDSGIIIPELFSHPPTTAFTAEELEKHISNSEHKLVLHFDINETILVGDDAGGDSVDDCFNKIIAKSAFVESSAQSNTLAATKQIEPTKWWDGTPLSESETKGIPPLYIGWNWPPNSCPYYRTAYKNYSKHFTKPDKDHSNSYGHGSVYRPLYKKLKESMLQPTEEHDIPSSHPFYRMIPSFFYTLVKLKEFGKDFTLVLRTFGSDLDDIALALRDFANGKHPHFPDFRDPSLALNECNMFRGRYRRKMIIPDNSSSDSIYDLISWNDQPIATGDDELLDVIESLNICGIQDDYEYWDANGNSPMAGKPCWIRSNGDDTSSPKTHHLFFDDNIHNDENDSIVALRSQGCDGRWGSLSGHDIIQMQGKYLIRVPTIAAILQKDWFLKQIAMAGRR